MVPTIGQPGGPDQCPQAGGAPQRHRLIPVVTRMRGGARRDDDRGHRRKRRNPMTTTEMNATATDTGFDGAKAEAFGGHIMGILSGGLLSLMVDIGHRTGLFAAAADGWATSEQLAGRTGLTERYVREWLGAMTTAGVVEYDQAGESFRLPPEHAALLITPTGVAPLAVTTTILARHVPQIVQAFREGGGVPYAAFGPEFNRRLGRGRPGR